jgi:hypothetical protein
MFVGWLMEGDDRHGAYNTDRGDENAYNILIGDSKERTLCKACVNKKVIWILK